MENNASSHYDYIYKILLLGDSAVGKTCFLLRYSDDTFTDNHISTIGLDYRFKIITLENEKIVKLQIWDTAGQDRFRAITKNYYKGAHGIILMYDITNVGTFNNIKNWVMQIKENTNEKVKIVLVGNKVDEEEQRKVSTQQGELLAKDYNLQFFETSAKNNIRVEEVFGYVTREIYNVNNKSSENLERRKSKANIALNDSGKPSKKKMECCTK
jgi:Ras-related protein Rab-1A